MDRFKIESLVVEHSTGIWGNDSTLDPLYIFFFILQKELFVQLRVPFMSMEKMFR